MQLRLSPQLIRPFFSRHHPPRLGGLALHYALPSYGRCTISSSSKGTLNTPTSVTQAREHKSTTEASQDQLKPIGQNSAADSVFPSTINSRELLLDLPNCERSPTDKKEATKSPHHGLNKELEDFHSWSYVKPDAPWGFVVYRAVYGKESDEPWKRMLRLLRDTVGGSLGMDNLKDAKKVDPQFEMTVMEDEERFADADSHTIREAFREWVYDDLPPRVLNPDAEGGIDNIRAMIRSNNIRETWEYGQEEPLHPWYIAPPRWGFCFLVDDICLRSFNRADGSGVVVKMVNMRFRGGRCESIAEGWEDGETDDPQEDVGWMYANAYSHRAWYLVLGDPTNWDDEVWYSRPEKEEYPIANDVGEAFF